jgi:hypothetical protein
MSKQLEIVKGKKADQKLSKEQKRFNTLVKKIKALRAQIPQVKALDLELRQLGDKRIVPSEKNYISAFREWVFALHNSSFKSKLSKKEQGKFAGIMQEEITVLLQHEFLHEDQELHSLFSEYEDDGRSFEELEAEKEQIKKRMATQMMKDMFGLDIEPDDIDNPEKMQEKIAEKRAEFEAEAQARTEEKNNRKKSESALAAEAKREEAALAVKKTTRQIYFDLVRHFHPDKEPDETLRAEKTELMKQITGAYDADDHLQLLELQMTMLTDRENVFADFDDAQLKYFNASLQQQAQELEEEIYFSSPEGNGNRYAMFYDRDLASILRNIERHVQKQKNAIKQTKKNIELIREERNFKDFVKSYEFEDDFDHPF